MPTDPDTFSTALDTAEDVIAEAKSDQDDPFLMGVLAGVEDSIDLARRRATRYRADL